MMDRRKQLDALKANHKVKMSLLSEILIKLEKGEKVDLQQELTLLSRIPTTKETEIDFDEKLNEFLQLADEPQEHAPVTKAQPSTYL
ncbi:hypothetical protein CLIB1444_10S02850 [[Candida] jaroonii]|uniref:Uncharacterized protein n=1 Tax=[Candida] jaroonii TaxID=467808 RepID=A0ACA9YCQ5_9ASCO|nr:hypothetical protein CLIB1444_10S02850 [[Candida] jaroonii]